ncbi:MAG: hypothetical protein JO306_13065 [Gemmatimonadetes bacterium]|nr:hypothetical protein [Gemmatimonadota bacterium]
MRHVDAQLMEPIVRRLEPLLDDVVFVGGQVTALLLTDPAATRTRVTVDVDIICPAVTRTQYERLAERLRTLGFREDTSEGAPICRWRSPDGILDVMPIGERALGFTNRWYPLAMETANQHVLPSGQRIRIPRAEVFLATKWSAVEGRAEGDYLGSHDLEDIVTLFAGRPELPGEVAAAGAGLRDYVAEQTARFFASEQWDYAILGALPDARFDPTLPSRVETRLRRVLAPD